MPMRSQAQWGLMFSDASPIGKDKAREWAHKTETPFRDLPRHVTKGEDKTMARMPFADYVAKCGGRPPMDKATFEDLDDDEYEKAIEPDEDDEEEEDEEEEEEAEKSLTLAPDEEELAKSMEFLLAMAESDQAAPAASRIATLSGRATAGTLEKSERAELARLLQEEGDVPLSDPLLKSQETQAAFEASEFLAAFGTQLAKSLDELATRVDVRGNVQTDFNRRLARGLDALAKSIGQERRESEQMVKSLAKQVKRLTKEVERVAGQPVPWAGKTHLTTGQLEKSGREGADLTLLQKSAAIPKVVAQRALSRLFDGAAEKNPELAKSLGEVLSQVSVTSGDWRSVRGMTADLVETVTRTAQSAG